VRLRMYFGNERRVRTNCQKFFNAGSIFQSISRDTERARDKIVSGRIVDSSFWSRAAAK